MQRSPATRRWLPLALTCSLLAPALATAQPANGPLALDNVRIIEAEHNRASTPHCVRV